MLGLVIGLHPGRHQIRLENIMSALGSPVRMRIFMTLAEGGEQSCGSILPDVPKSTLTRHWQVLRDSGVIWQHPHGRENLLSIRREDLDARFPGLLDSLLAAARANDEL
jgi:DNA-binding transcriptional ArsR family regulator